MAKDPAFLFYPGDWLGGTMGMTFEQKGAYFELLIFQFNNGRFSKAQAEQVLSTCFASVWHMVVKKFTLDGDLYYNVRLEEEINKRKKFSESRKKNASGTKNKELVVKAYAKHMEDENENTIGIKYKRDEDFFKTNEEAHTEIKRNYHETEKARSILTNRGWITATDFDVEALLFHFLTSQVDLGSQTKADVRSHFKRWLNKQKIDEMMKLILTIKAKYERGQRQQVEVLGTTNSIPGPG